MRIKQELKTFVSDVLKLELSDEKTKITHSSEYARFLGYDVCVRRNSECKRKTNGTVQRTLNNSVELLVPLKDKIEPFMFHRGIMSQGKDGQREPSARRAMVGLSDLEVLDTYNAQTRGICNYYGLASNFAKLTYFVYMMEYSCLKTLAMKHKSHISKIKRMYKAGKGWGIPYETKTGQRRMMALKFSDFKRFPGYSSDVDRILQKIHFANLRANKCELCGKDEGTAFEIHHVKRLRDLKGKEQWERAMIARKRKTLIVCKECHTKIHHQERASSFRQ